MTRWPRLNLWPANTNAHLPVPPPSLTNTMSSCCGAPRTILLCILPHRFSVLPRGLMSHSRHQATEYTPTAWPTTPSADSCAAVRSPRGSLSSEIGTRRRPPQVSSIAFPAPLPDLQPWPLMDMDFVISRPLVRPRMPDIRFLFVRSRFCSALPSDATSR